MSVYVRFNSSWKTNLVPVGLYASQGSGSIDVHEWGTFPTSLTRIDILLWYFSWLTASSCVTSKKDWLFTSKIWSPIYNIA